MSLSNDTVMRCSYCRGVVLHKHVEETGGCKRCGSRRMAIAFSVEDHEWEEMLADGYQPDPEKWSDKPMELLNG